MLMKKTFFLFLLAHINYINNRCHCDIAYIQYTEAKFYKIHFESLSLAVRDT